MIWYRILHLIIYDYDSSSQLKNYIELHNYLLDYYYDTHSKFQLHYNLSQIIIFKYIYICSITLLSDYMAIMRERGNKI